MAAGGGEPVLVEEHDANIAAGAIWWHHHAAVHVGVATWFVAEEAPMVIQVRHCPGAPVQYRVALHATQVHDPEGFAGSVVVVGDDHLAGAQHHGDEP